MKYIIIFVFILCATFSSCKRNVETNEILVNAIDYRFNIDSYILNGKFEIDSLCLDDGYIVRHITSKNGPDNGLYTIHSSEGNLILIAGKCSESVDVSGYAFGYNASGLIDKIWNVQPNKSDDIIKFEYNAIDVFDWKKAVEPRDPTYILTYDDNGELKHIDGIETPNANYNISAFVTEGADFWINDIQGGDIHLIFYYHMNSNSQQDGLTDLVFIDGKIAAEILFNEHKETTIHLFTSQGNSLTVLTKNGKDDDMFKLILDKFY